MNLRAGPCGSMVCETLLAFSLTWLSATQSLAVDSDHCQAALEGPDSAARVAEAVSIVQLEKQTADRSRRELHDCLNFPGLYDTRGDRCESMTLEYQYAKRRYQSARRLLESRADDRGAQEHSKNCFEEPR